jgi:hypothetical protein
LLHLLCLQMQCWRAPNSDHSDKERFLNDVSSIKTIIHRAVKCFLHSTYRGPKESHRGALRPLRRLLVNSGAATNQTGRLIIRPRGGGSILVSTPGSIPVVAKAYGGMVATGVADRARDKIKHLVYLDAFAPESAKSVSDYYFPGDRRQAVLKTLIDG